MPEVPTPIEVGFAEFVARLISEVFSSVVTAQAEQEERYAELLAAAELSEQEYADRQLSEADLNAELQRRFPPRKADEEQSHAIYLGAPYLPAKGEQEESPPLAAYGIVLTKSDLRRQQNGPLVLKASAVEKISQQVAEQLARIQLGILRGLAARGVPRVMVEGGRINGKMTFHLLEENEAPPADTTDNATGSSAPSTPLVRAPLLNRLVLPQARILPNVKLLVRQADERSPESTQVKANVFGEVEISFKTVT